MKFIKKSVMLDSLFLRQKSDFEKKVCMSAWDIHCLQITLLNN